VSGEEIVFPSSCSVSVSLTSPALANVCAVATVGGDGNGAAGGGPVRSGVEVARARRMLHVVLVSPLVSGNCCLLILKVSALIPVADCYSIEIKKKGPSAILSSNSTVTG
jgi:hypothetical protein